MDFENRQAQTASLQGRSLAWIVARSLAWPRFNRRLSNDYERYVQTSETLPDIAAIHLMLNRVSPE
jgi:hypothetical protein